jgi:hypothetical protein
MGPAHDLITVTILEGVVRGKQYVSVKFKPSIFGLPQNQIRFHNFQRATAANSTSKGARFMQPENCSPRRSKLLKL